MLRGDTSPKKSRRFDSRTLQELLDELQLPPGVEWPEFAAEHLSARECEVLRRRVRGETLAVIGAAIGLSGSGVALILGKAVRKLRYHASVWAMRLEAVAAQPVPSIDPRLAEVRVEDLGLPPLVTHILLNAGFPTVGVLMEWTRRDVARIYGIGPISIRKIEESLASLGLSLAP